MRPRLVAAFLIVSALSALITAALTFRQARASILERTQSTAVHDLRTLLESLAPELPEKPQQADLQNLVATLDRAGGTRRWRTAAAYGDGPLVTARKPGGARVASDALRKEARKRNAAVLQRIDSGGELWLVIAMPVDSKSGGASTGLVVTAELSLADDKRDIAALVTAAEAGAVPALVLAVGQALFAARRVLRPVRQLRTAAEEITGGRLDTRLPARGRDELADLTRTFNTMAAALEKGESELRRIEENARRFAADVSHELRTPLAAMSAVTELLDEEAGSGHLGSDSADALRLISGETRKLTRLVDDLMEISRFDARAAALHLDEVDIAEAVCQTLQLRSWEDQVTLGLLEGLRVRLDPRRLDVVLANLIGNALRHGGAPVDVLVHTDGYRLLIEVADRGPGIDPAALPHVFDRFYKADAARTRSAGSGLGLAIALENARLHGGTITAANGPNGGAVFTVSLPLALPGVTP